MGMYDNYDVDTAKKAGILLFVFCLVLCLVLVCANLFAGAAIAWKWVFSPVWGPFALGLVLRLFGFKPPQ